MRMIRTLRRLGVRSVAVFSDADRSARHVLEADDALYLGATPARESYLNIERVLDACARSGANAVHPGYGFLSENPNFADACIASGVVFIGPSADAIRLMGDKIQAKFHVAASGVPVVPGRVEAGMSDDDLDRRRQGDRLSGAREAVSGRRRARACNSSNVTTTSLAHSRALDARRRPRSATTRCSSSASWSGLVTSRCRCSPISTAPRSISVSGNVRFNVVIRRWSKSHRHHSSMTPRESDSAHRRSPPRAASTTTASVRSSSSSLRRDRTSTSSWR